MTTKSKVAVVMVPCPAQSHLNQLLQLATLISSRSLPVHFLGTATHNRQAKLRAGGLDTGIQFHDFPIGPIATPEPNPTTADKIPVHITPAIIAYMGLGGPICSFVQQLSTETTRVVLIYDWVVAPAVKLAVSIPSVESYAFSNVPALHVFSVLWESMGKPFDVEGEVNHLPPARELYPESIIGVLTNRPPHFDDREGDIYNSSRVIEGKYIDLLGRKEFGGGKEKKLWAIQPLSYCFSHDTSPRHECLQWLDKQAPRSVVYVCFGSAVTLTDEEIRELAAGLEQSGKKFIWVVREADKADIFAGEARRVELREGFEERVRENGNGIVVRDWAPQQEILAHQSTGGFMTHCGWNSLMESLICGVPVAAWPMHSDQPLIAIFVTEFLKVGVYVREWAAREELVRAPAIKNAVERLLSREEMEIRKRAEELGAALRKSMEEGGEFWRELDSFIAHITRD